MSEISLLKDNVTSNKAPSLPPLKITGRDVVKGFGYALLGAPILHGLTYAQLPASFVGAEACCLVASWILGSWYSSEKKKS